MQSYDDKIRELLQQTDFTHVPYIDTGAPQRSWRQIVILVDGVDLPSDPLHSDPNRSLILWVLLIAILALPANSSTLAISLLLLVSQSQLYRSLYLGSKNRLVNRPIAISTNC